MAAIEHFPFLIREVTCGKGHFISGARTARRANYFASLLSNNCWLSSYEIWHDALIIGEWERGVNTIPVKLEDYE